MRFSLSEIASRMLVPFLFPCPRKYRLFALIGIHYRPDTPKCTIFLLDQVSHTSATSFVASVLSGVVRRGRRRYTGRRAYAVQDSQGEGKRSGELVHRIR